MRPSSAKGSKRKHAWPERARKPAVSVQFSRLISTQITESGQLRRFGITTPTPLPARGGAASTTPCWPREHEAAPPDAPQNDPLVAEEPRAAISRRVAKRASPCSGRRRGTKKTAVLQQHQHERRPHRRAADADSYLRFIAVVVAVARDGERTRAVRVEME